MSDRGAPGTVLALQDVNAFRGPAHVLRGVSVAVRDGETVCLVGRNGAGKTTTLKILLGMLRKDDGRVEALGWDASTRAGSLEIRRRAAFAGENKELYPFLTVREVIYFVRGFFPAWRADLEQRYLERFELPPNHKIGNLSRGMHTKLMMLLALARGAELLVLDEPTDGLDPAVSEEVMQAIVSAAAEQEASVFFASHNLAEVEQIADQVCIIEAGRTVLCEQLDELRAGYRMVQAVFDSGVPKALQFAGVERVECNGRWASLLVARDVQGVIEQVRAQGGQATDVRPVALKEIFLNAVKGSRT